MRRSAPGHDLGGPDRTDRTARRQGLDCRPEDRIGDSTEILPGIAERAFIDIDSLLRPVYGHAKQGASYGHSKIAGTQILRKGLSPLATIISTADSAPVISGMRLGAGKAGSGTGAARMVAQAVTTARKCGATGKIMVRGD